jgi:hypothetical protein
MGQYIAINSGDYASEVPIVNLTTGKSTSIFLQSKARAKLPEGFTIQDQFSKLNPAMSQVDTVAFKKQADRLTDTAAYYAAYVQTPSPSVVAQEAIASATEAGRNSNNNNTNKK